MNKIKRTVEYFFKKYDLTNSTPILLAFSGGYDSMCLADVLQKMDIEFTAIHLNHNWRGIESDKEENHCKNFCDSKNINFYSEKLPPNTPKTETAAREARYAFFEKCMKKFNSNVVLTAHNANDNAETLLYRITKGTGIKGLSGIREKRDNFYRPILNITREDIENYCQINNLAPNNDSSNNNTKYKRNLIRKEVIPKLKTINTNIVNTLNSLAENAINDNAIIEEYIKTLKNPYETKNFITYSSPLQLRLLYELITTYDLDYDKYKINQILSFIKENHNLKSGKKFSLNDDLFLFVNEKEIKIITPVKKSNQILNIAKQGEYEFGNKKFIIQEYKNEISTFPDDSNCLAYADLSKYDKLELRYRQDGDFIKPLGCKGKQKIKKYLNEKKIPSYQKDTLIMLASEDEILWIPSIGISDNIKVVTTPTHMLQLINMEK